MTHKRSSLLSLAAMVAMIGGGTEVPLEAAEEPYRAQRRPESSGSGFVSGPHGLVLASDQETIAAAVSKRVRKGRTASRARGTA